MGCVLYCIGTCKQIIIGTGGYHDMVDGIVDEGSCSGTFICEDCEKNGTADKSHPFYAFSQTESQVKQNGTLYWNWTKHPVSKVMP